MKNAANSSKKPSIDLVAAIPALERYASKGGWICFLAGFVGALVLGWCILPMALYSSQAQPVNFNHVVHLDGETETESCLNCHAFREDGTFVGIPGIEKCQECHDDPESPLGETEEEAVFMEKYIATGNEIPWLAYSRQPDCVYFSHIAHVQMGEIACATCHGDHADSEILPKYKQNIISTYPIGIWGKRISGIYFDKKPSDRMKMDDCAGCHSKKGHEENNACFVCHK